MWRLAEAVAAGFIVGVIALIVALRLDWDPVLVPAISFLLGFAGWGATGFTLSRHGRGGWFY